jgi:hypothetical protein
MSKEFEFICVICGGEILMWCGYEFGHKFGHETSKRDKP